MAAKDSHAEQISRDKNRPTRKVEELHFAEYIKHKKNRKHLEELAVKDFVNSKKPSGTN